MITTPTQAAKWLRSYHPLDQLPGELEKIEQIAALIESMDESCRRKDRIIQGLKEELKEYEDQWIEDNI